MLSNFSLLLFLSGLGLGLLLGWLIQITRSRRQIISAHVEAETAKNELARSKENQDKIAELMKGEFRNLASEILDQKSQLLTEKSKEQLGGVLSPFKENLELFRKRVEEIHTSHIENSGNLRQKLEQLSSLNHQLSADAQNLASALQGRSQRRGAWGELILERTLELSGLERGREFEVQVSTENRLRPDAVIYLAEDRLIVVDSKVSLVDYERSCNAVEEKERQEALGRHAAAVRTHIKSLSEKKYADLFAGKTAEMIMMFLPIEPAFGAALSADPELFEFAFSHRIILVTPSTLLAALRTINNFWKMEKQTKNVLEIARLGGILHDRLVDFSNNLIAVRGQLTKALSTQDEAIARLSSQKGNIIATAQRLHKLGAKAEKKMPQELMENFSEDEAQ